MRPWLETILLVVVWVTVFPAMVLGGLMFLGLMVDSYSDYRIERDRCFKNATNGYEMKQCR